MAKSSGFATARDTHDGTDGTAGVYDISVYQDAAIEPSISGGSPNLATRTLATVPSGWAVNPTPGTTDPRWRSRTIIDPNLLSGLDKKEKTTLTFNGLTGGTNNAAVAEQTYLGLTGDKAGSDATTPGAAEITDVSFTGTGATGSTGVSSGVTDNLNAVAYGDSTYLAVGDGGTILSSSNSTTWSSETDQADGGDLIGIVYGNSKFINVDNSNGIRMYSSTNQGSSWSSVSHAFGFIYIDPTATRLSYVGSNFILILNTASSGYVIGVSGSGDSDFSDIATSAKELGGSAFGNSTYVVVGDEIAYTASNPTSSWSSTTTGLSGVFLLDVAYGDSKFVAVGKSGALRTSTNGTSWTTQTAISGNDITSITYDGADFYATDSVGVLKSANGTSWDREFAQAGLNEVESLNSIIVGVGDGGLITSGTEGSGDSISVTFDSSHSSVPIVYTSTSEATGGTQDSDFKTAVDAAITAGTLTGITSAAVTDAVVSTNPTVTSDGTRLTSTATGERTDATVIITGGSGSTASSAVTVTTDGSDSSTGTATSYVLTAGSPHSPSQVSGTFANDLTKANALIALKAHFDNDDIGGYTAGAIADNKFNITSDTTGDEADITFVINPIGTGGNLVRTRDVHIPGSDFNTVGGNTLTINIDGIAYSVPFTAGESASAQATTVNTFLSNTSAVTDDYVLTFDNEGLIIEAKTIGNRDDIQRSLDSGKLNQTATTPSRVIIQGNSVALIWSTPVEDGLRGIDGLQGFNTATVSVYQRKSTLPTDTPNTIGTYTFSTANLLFPSAATSSNNWHTTRNGATGSEQLYIRSATIASRDATDDIATNEWSGIVQAGTTGTDGEDGLSNQTVIYYQRTSSSTTPTVKPNTQSAYNFGTGVLTPITNNGWQTFATLSSTGKYLWAVHATASSRTATDSSIGISEWSDAILVNEDGDDGTDGATWHYASGVPVTSLGNIGDLYLRTDNEAVYTKISSTVWTVTITTIKGNTGEQGEDGASITGATGDNGDNVNFVFLESSSAPTKPSPSSGVPSGWSDSAPTSPTNDVYTTQGIQTNGTGNYVWGDVIKLTGAKGDAGSVWHNGTGVPSNSLGANGDFYLRTSNEDVYTKSGGAWSVTSNIKGDTGGTGNAGATADVTDFVFRDSASVPSSPADSAGVPSGWLASAPASVTNTLYTVRGIQTAGAGNFNWGSVIRLTGDTGDKGDTGDEGDKGDTGDTGAAGIQWYSDTGAPSNSLGAEGDFYLRTDNEAVYKKGASVWAVTIATLKGNTGNTGGTGTDADVINWVFQDASSVPTKPSASAGVPSGWVDSAPTSVTNTLYTTQGIQALGTGNFTWGNVIKLSGDDGSNGDKGDTGTAGTRSAKGVVYFSLAQASAPSVPAATTYNYTSGAFTGLSTNWSTSASTIVANQSNSYWQCSYLVTEATFGGTQTRTFGTPQKIATFTNILASGGIAAGQSLKVGDIVASDTAITSGSGAILEADGDFFVGDDTNNIVFDQSAGTFTVNGEIIVAGNIKLDGVTIIAKADGSLEVGSVYDTQVITTGTTNLSLNLDGGNGTNASGSGGINNAGNGIAGGNHTLTTVGNITVNVSSQGGRGGNATGSSSINNAGNGGRGGNITLTSQQGNITITSLNVSGGAGGTASGSGSSNNQGNTGGGGTVVLTASNGCVSGSPTGASSVTNNTSLNNVCRGS